MVTTVLFDLDGTLIDTEPTGAFAMQEVFAESGVLLTDAQAHEIIGRTWASAIERLRDVHQVKGIEKVSVDRVKERYRQRLREELHLVPGSIDAVRRMAEAFRIGLVTGSYRAEVDFVLDFLKIRPLFQVIQTAEDYRRGKPAPDGYLQAMQALQVGPKETLVFEDSRVGLQSARSAGAHCVLVQITRTATSEHTLADRVIRDWSVVTPEWVLRE